MARRATILVVDDEADVRELLSTVLSRHGFEILTADSGHAALEKLTNGEVSLVLLDLLLPDTTGIEVLARIRARHSMMDLPVVILTGHASNENLLHALEIGANEFLVKPLSLPLIMARIEAQLHIKKALDELRKAESQVRDTLNAIPDVIFRADERGIILDTSAARVQTPDWISLIRKGEKLVECLPESMERVLGEFAASRRPEGQVEVTRCKIDEATFEVRMVSCSQCETVCIVRDISEQSRFENELFQLARTDALTQIANRRQFDEVLTAEWRRAARHHTPLAVALVDVDHFKRYNDSQGHLAGDECLRAVSKAISQALLRAGDFLARYGGEEFGIVMPNTDLNGARRVAERIRKCVEGLDLEHPGSPLGKVTVSLGIAACLPTQEPEPANLVQVADEALYEAKKAGRNRVAEKNYEQAVFSVEC